MLQKQAVVKIQELLQAGIAGRTLVLTLFKKIWTNIDKTGNCIVMIQLPKLVKNWINDNKSTLLNMRCEKETTFA